MKNYKTVTDKYEVCLLGWYYGMEPAKVRQLQWTQEEIDKAQRYCELKMADPVAVWGSKY